MPSDSQTVPLSQLDEGEPHVELLIVHRGRMRQVAVTDRAEIVVGRGDDATVCVRDRGLSRRHLCVRIDGTLATVTDLGSSNGTFLRGTRLEPGIAHRVPFDVPVSASETTLLVHGSPGTTKQGPHATAVETARRLAASLLNVAFVGERGVGKRWLATALHRASPRAASPLVEIDLRKANLEPRSVLPGQTLLLVGLEAVRPLEQDRLASRLAATHNVRVLSSIRAASMPAIVPSLRRIVAEVEILLPPMSELGDELDAIIQTMAAEAAARMQLGQTPQLDAEALARLRSHRYRDGFRELRGILDRAVARSDTPSIGVDALELGSGDDRWTAEERRERERIIAALHECAGNQSRAAKMLNVSRGTLVGRLDKYGLRRPRK